MKWHKSLIGNFVDTKVREFEFDNTAVLVTKWYDFDKAIEELEGLHFFWFKHTNSPYTDREAVVIYFVRVDTREEGDGVIGMVKELSYFTYARFYEGESAIKALKNFTEKV